MLTHPRLPQFSASRLSPSAFRIPPFLPRRLTCLPLLSVFLALAAALPAADSAAAPARRPITAEDLWAVKRPGALDLSPDGSKLVFTVQEFDLAKNTSKKNLRVLDTATGAVRALTTADASDNSPVWSPDGTRVAFTAKRAGDEQPALYVIRADGGEAEKILELPLAISSPKWLPDSQRLVVATNVLPAHAADLEAMKKELKKQKDSKVTAKVSESGVMRFFDTWQLDGQAKHLILVDTATKRTVDLTPKWDRRFTYSDAVDFDLSPDGKSLVLSAGSTPPPIRDQENRDLFLLSIEKPETAWKNLTADNPQSDSSPRFSPDGKSLLFSRTRLARGLSEQARLFRLDLASGTLTRLAADLDVEPQAATFSADGRTVFFRAEDRGRTKLWATPAAGGASVALVTEGTNSEFVVGPRHLHFLRQSFTRPDEIWSYDLAARTAAVRTGLNDTLFAGLELGRVEEYTFTGAAGDTVQGWLIYPPRFDPAKKYPLVQLMHGGPATMIGDMWQPRWNAQVFASPGYVVTWVNRHGSTGFGEKFLQSIDGQWGDKPFEDVMKSTDFLLAKHAFLDATRTAAMGASYGGYLATWVAGHTDRFKAIVCHAGVTDFDTQYASDVALLWQSGKMGGTPWQRTAAYEKQNPMTHAANFKTPTLVIHGELDYRVPVAQGIQFYAALQGLGVPSRFVYYPDENHWILKPQNSVHWYGEVRDWLARWLK